MSLDKPWSDLPSKATPVNADILAIIDSADSDPDTTNKTITIGSLPAGVGGITSINGDTSAAQIIDTGTGIVINNSGPTHTLSLSAASTDLTDSSVIVRTNQANTFGDFNQTFADDKLFIQDPSTSFAYQFVASGLADNRSVTLPTLGTDDTFVFENLLQTLTNKTLTTPTINNFTNATHDHEDPSGGGQLTAPDALDATGTTDSTTFLRGDNTWSVPAGTGDMVLASIQTVTGAKTFGTIGGDVDKFILAGSTSGSTIFNAAAIAGSTTITLPGTTGTVVITGLASQITIGSEVTGASTSLTDTADIAYLNTPNIFIAGNLNQFGHDSTNAGFRLVPFAGNPSVQNDGEIWYNLTSNVLFARINGADIDLAAGAGSGITSLAGDTAAIQTLTAGDGIDIVNSTPDHLFAVDSSVARSTDNLSFFSATTSAQLLGVISDETGSGALVFSTSPTITAPFIGDFTNSPHSHSNATGGGTLVSTAALSDTDDIAYLNTANIWTVGEQDFSTVEMKIPVSATPSITEDGDIAYDSTVTDFSTGLIRFFGTEAQGIVSMPLAEFTTPTDGFVVTYSGTNDEFVLTAAPGGGDVSGPASSTDNAITRFDGTTGKLLQDGIITIDDVANVEEIRSLQFTSFSSAPTGTTHIALVSSDFHINTTTGNNLQLMVNDTLEYQFDSTTADFKSNNLTMGAAFVQFTSISEPTVTGSDSVGKVFMDSGNLNHLSIRRNGASIDLEEIVFPINFPELAGGNATATQDIDFSITTRHSQQFTLTQNTTLTFSGTVTDTTEYIDLFIVQDGTGGWTLTLPVGTINAAEVEAGINLGAGEETFILLKFAFGTFYAFLQGIQTSTGITSLNGDTAAIQTLTGGIGIDITDTAGDHSFAIDSTVVTLTGTQTLTNKTLTEPRFADLGFIADANGNEMLSFDTVTTAVNYTQLANSDVGNELTLSALGTDTDIDFRFIPKGTGTFYGNRETWGWPLTDESTAPTTGVKFTTEPAPYDMSIEDIIGGLTTAGTGATLFTMEILKENSVNADAFTTILSTKVTIDASEFTSTTAATAPVLSVTTWEKGRRLQLEIDTLDTNGLARGAKIELITHATAK